MDSLLDDISRFVIAESSLALLEDEEALFIRVRPSETAVEILGRALEQEIAIPLLAASTVNRSKKYLSVLAELRKQLGALQTAAVHARASESKPEVIGKFELYDALGDEPTKNAVASVLRKATRAMTTLGLGAYCYGNVTIVNSSKIHSHSSAFYAKNTDEIYVGNMKGQDVRAVCHEIGHRIHTKLNLRNKTRSLYETVKDRGTWISDYAKTDDEENFCEMLSFAAVKDLPDEGKDLLKTVVPKIKLATAAGVVARLTQTLTVADRCADRVARRHLLATAADVRDHLREEHQMLDASRLLKPRTLRVIEPAACCAGQEVFGKAGIRLTGSAVRKRTHRDSPETRVGPPPERIEDPPTCYRSWWWRNPRMMGKKVDRNGSRM